MKKRLLQLLLVSFTIVSQAQINTFPYSEDFEGGDGSWTPSGSLWENGVPATPIFVSANTPCTGAAFVTNLDGNYPVNANNTLTSPYFDFTNLSSDPVIYFDMFRNVEALFDGVWLEMTIDSGSTWQKVMGPGNNWYNNAGEEWWDDDTEEWTASSTTLSGSAGHDSVAVRFVFYSDLSVTDEGVGVDNISIVDGAFTDIQLVEILSPTSGAGLSSTEAVTVVVSNLGMSVVPFTDYAICYNGDVAQACETTVSDLQPGATDTLTLLGTMDLSTAGTYNINVYVSLFSPDINLCNDTMSVQITNQQIISAFPYQEDFQNGQGSWITSGNEWELGIPTTTAFEEANTACIDSAFVTNLDGSYSNNLNNYLTSPSFDFSGFVLDPTIAFDMFRELEGCCDETWLEMSLDGGNNWSKVSGPGVNWYNDISNDWWNNDTEGWEFSSVNLTGSAGQSDVKLRFVIRSDFSASYEGVGIDNIYIGDSAFTEIQLVEVLSPSTGGNLSSAETVTIVVQNNGGSTVPFTDYAICYNGDIAQACSSTTTDLLPGATDTITVIGTMDLSEYGTYNINVYISLNSPDLNTCNDSLTIEITNIESINNFPYAEDFQNGDGGWLASDTLWEHGIPTTTVMENANTSCIGSAFVTNLDGDYPNNASNYLTSPLFDFTGWNNDPILAFDMLRDMELCCDEVWLEMSLDAGITWSKVMGPGANWYNDLGNDWWDSSTDDWTHTNAQLTGAAGESNVMVRFAFFSDLSVTLEGVGVDNIYIGDTTFVDLELVEVLSPSNGCNLSASEEVTVVVANNGYTAVPFSDYAICYNGDFPQSCGTTVTDLEPLSLDTITLLGTVDMSELGTYIANFYLSLSSSDLNTCNDTLTYELFSSEEPVSALGADTSIDCGGIILNGGEATNYLWSTGDTSSTIEATESGTYILELENPGCPVVLDTITVNLGSDLMVQVDSVWHPLCNGDGNGAAFASVSGAVEPITVDWDNDGTGDNDDDLEIISLTAGTYTIMVTDLSGCTVSDSAIIMDPQPLQLTAVVTDEIDQGSNGEIDLTVNGGTPGYVYEWDNFEFTEDIENLSAGSYMVTVIDTNGCMDSLTVTVNNVPVGVFGLGADQPMVVYPNPSSGVFGIYLSDVKNIEYIAITDALGKQVYYSEIVKPSNLLNLNLKSGIYFIRAKENETESIEKLIVR